MADANSLHSLTSTLASPMGNQGSPDQQHAHAQHQHMSNTGEPQNHPGSGKKPVDPNAPPKVKRPVGRPRKDGLPAGSVGPRRPSRPRKRPPGTYATGAQPGAPGVYPYGTPFVGDPAWASASAPPMGARPGRPPMFPIDPSLDADDWGELSRSRPDKFLHALVSALEAPNPPSAAGPSVEEAFKSHLVSLAPNSKNAAIPQLYSILKTFWLPSSPVYFSLTASASTARTPPEHRFLYWDPQPLVFNGIACPTCNGALTNRGRISSGPIKVYDLGKPFFVIACEYVCTSPACIATTGPQGRKFASTDASILRALPTKLKDEFPALLLQGNPDLGTGPEIWNWHGMGVSTALWNMVRASLHARLQKDAILDIVRAIQHGTSDFEYVTYKQEEEEGEQGEEEEEDPQDAHQVEGDLGDKDKTIEEFEEAWNANSGVAEPNGAAPPMQEQAGPSNSAPDHTVNGQHGAGAPPQAPAPAQAQPQAQGPPPPPPPHYAYAPPAGPYQPYPYGYPYWQQQPEQQPPTSLKRTFSIVDGTPEPGMSEPLHKRVRHCCKCGSNECKGKGGRAFCTNPCQDCGKLECKGRNSKRPDRTCADAWP
ncbi:hypothetical protein C8Q80DRAFT_1161512 [Daedaleopsis nitida]|nr:hypothetical protein C8Q80DRAFT_1161512 [Daedaleopsis nitida]